MLAIKVHRTNDGVYLYVLNGSLNAKKEIVYSACNVNLKDMAGLNATKVNLLGYEEPVWQIPLNAHDKLVEKLAASNPKRIFEIVPKYILNLLYPRAWVFESNLRSVLPLLPFQKQGIEYIISRMGRGIIADGMGLGKTMQGLGLLEYYSYLRPALIICPAAVKTNWKVHIQKYLGISATVLKNNKSLFDQNGINIVSYQLTVSPKMEAYMNEFKPLMMILDESHYIKNVKSKRTKRAFLWSKHAKSVVLLTGTPMNKCTELYSQIKCVNQNLFPKYFHYMPNKVFHCIATNRKPLPEFFFASRYCKPELKYVKGHRTIIFKGSDNEAELHAILREHVMIRRTKEEVLQDLPDKSREMVVIDEWHQDKPMDMSSDAQFIRLIIDTSTRKIPFIQKYIKEILVEEIRNDVTMKVLIWGYYRAMLDGIHDALEEEHIRHVVMDGRTPQDQRTKYIDEFQEPSSELRVAVLGLGSMNAGITLTAASLSIVCELCFNPDIHYQAEDRNHRIGQTKPVTTRYLLCEGSTDDIIWKVLEKKTKVTGLIIDNSKKTFEPETKRRRVDEEERTTVDVPFDDL